MIRHKLFLCSVAIFLSLYPTKAYAADFSSKYSVLYKINQDGPSEVIQQITTTNLVPEYYLSKYTIELGNQKISSVSATEKNKTLKTTLQQEATHSSLTVEFPDKTVGKNIAKAFTLRYQSNTTLQRVGNIYNITIPKIEGAGITNYDTQIEIPSKLGKINTLQPEPKEKKESDDKTILTYTTEQVTSTPITITLGSEQYYTLGLTYHVKNPQIRSVYTEIALPMNTPYQKIIYDNLTPRPSSIVVDDDGNYIARYTLLPKQELDIQFTGKAIVYKEKQYDEPELTRLQRDQYTQKQRYWETDNIAIATLAAKLRTPEKIYQYVVNSLKYDTSKLGSQDFMRQGAVGAVNNPNESVCMEFTDLFIAITRAAGIPAREIDGYAYTSDPISRPVSLSQDILHAWPEYYDEEKGWVQVDPTWQNTTHGVDYFDQFDLSHIAFVRKGLSSESPYPAGSYKGGQADTRDVLVSFSDSKPQINEEIEIDPDKKQTVFAGNKISVAASIKNRGNSTLRSVAQKTITYGDDVIQENELITVPPFSSLSLVLINKQSKPSQDQSLVAKITIGNKSGQTLVIVTPWYKSVWTYMAVLYGIGIPVLCVTLYKNLHKKSLKHFK